ncbi:hypothetical protein PLCT2_02569 [Planctomycetaceae bacterium]|nr:hypothetical protein PLCT2_02569 [Planctomycetaceae bacterium]
MNAAVVRYNPRVPEILPGVLYRSKRGICPTCGAAMKLREAGRFVKCEFCGGQSMVERRLRKLDGTLIEEELKHDGEHRESDTRHLAKALGDAQAEDVNCPGCGMTFEGDIAHDIQTCAACGTQCKIERRMVRPDAEPREAPQRRNHADFHLQRRDKSPLKWDVQTEQLCWRVINEPDPVAQVALAQKFEAWSYINASLVYFLPHLLELARKKGPALAIPLCDCVGKLLCQEDERLHGPTIETCEPFAYDLKGPPEVLDEVALGNARGMKLLLDSADLAARAGDTVRAARACWGASTMIDRNFPQHPIIAEIVFYRMFYLSGPVLGWALNLLESGTGGYVFKDWKQVLEFADDCAFEAPDLVGIVAKRAWPQPVKNLAELEERIAFVNARLSKAGKAAAIAKLFALDESAPPEVWARAVPFVEAALDDAELHEAATDSLQSMVKDPRELKPAVIEMIQRRGHTLPEIVQRQVHWSAPENKLLDRNAISLYYTSPPEKKWPPRVAEALKLYDESIRQAVNERHEATEELRELWQRARELDVDVFEGDENEPATAGELPPPPPTPQEMEQRELEARAERAQSLMQKASERYMAVVQTLQHKGADFMNSSEFKAAQRDMEALQRRVDLANRRGYKGADTFEDEKGIAPPPIEKDHSPEAQAQAEYLREMEALQQEMQQAYTKGANAQKEYERISARMMQAVEKLNKRMEEIHREH